MASYRSPSRAVSNAQALASEAPLEALAKLVRQSEQTQSEKTDNLLFSPRTRASVCLKPESATLLPF